MNHLLVLVANQYIVEQNDLEEKPNSKPECAKVTSLGEGKTKFKTRAVHEGNQSMKRKN